MKKYIEVFTKLIRRFVHHRLSPAPVLISHRYKYLQKPLEEGSLPTLLQYINRWETMQKEKFAMAVGLLLAQGFAGAACLQSLTKDHLVKNGVFLSPALV